MGTATATRRNIAAMFVVILGVLVLAACGDDDLDDSMGDLGDLPGGVDVDGGDDGGDGEVVATVTIGGETWELTNLACLPGVGSLQLAASTGLIGVNLSAPTLQVTVNGDWEGTSGGEITSTEIVFFEGVGSEEAISFRSTGDDGNAQVVVDGSRVSGSGSFDDVQTEGSAESEEGVFEASCPEELEAPEVVTTTIPDYEAHGSVTVGGETFVFTYDAPGGRCGYESNAGRVGSSGYLVDDPTREVVLTYATAEMSDSGEESLQLIVYGPGNEQLWYSAIGFGGGGTGTIESMTVDGDTLRITGTLLRSGSNPEEFEDFTAEATCNG